MKKQFRFLALALLSSFLFVSCGDDPEVTVKDDDNNTQEQNQEQGGGDEQAPSESVVTIENGAVTAAFSVSSTTQVYFSQGNLQYQASTGTWKFADNQYDIIGADNANISATYSGYIDLFAWATSDWSGGVRAYQPYATETYDDYYYLGGSSSNSIAGDYANADWGVYNAIANGGNEAGQWRTLTQEEWNYVIKDRKNASDLYSVAKVNNVNGLLILPDAWETPSSLQFTSRAYSWATNVYTEEEWKTLESAGAIFLPAAGYRSGTVLTDVGAYGAYWSTTANSDLAYSVFFSASNVSSKYGLNRSNGASVRLVKNI